MALSQRTIDISQLEQTRANLSILCIHLLGLDATEKAAHMEAIYFMLFNKEISKTIHSDLNSKARWATASKMIPSLINETRDYVARISDDDVRKMLRDLIDKYALKLKAAPILHDLFQQHEKITNFCTDPIVKKKSQKAWDKTWQQLTGRMYLQEKHNLLPAGTIETLGLVLFGGIFSIIARTIIILKTSRIPFDMQDFAIRLGLMIAGFLAVMRYGSNAFISNILDSKSPNKIKYNVEAIDEILKTGMNKLVLDYFNKKREALEKLEQRLAALRDVVIETSPEMESSDTESASDEEKPYTKPQKQKSRPGYTVAPVPEVEVKEQKNVFDTVVMRANKMLHHYERIGNTRAGLFFHFDPIKMNALVPDSSGGKAKFEAAILTRRYNQPHRKKLGVTELSRSELQKEKGDCTHKVRIKSKERLFLALRDPTPEEASGGVVKRVLSPRRLAGKH